jgi:hypothetical protein
MEPKPKTRGEALQFDERRTTMPNSKAIKAIKSSSRAVRAARPTKKAIDRAWTGGAQYVVPATAVAVGGGVLAGGFLMRNQLLSAASTVASTVARHLNADEILGLVGVQRRRGVWAMAAPALGVLAAGAVVGAGLAYWLLPFSDESSHEANSAPTPSVGAGSAMSPHP